MTLNFVKIPGSTIKQNRGNKNDEQISQINLSHDASFSNNKSECFCSILFLKGFYKDL